MSLNRELRLHFDFAEDDGWTIARCVEVPGALTQGRTIDEARTMAIDALELMLSPDAEPEPFGEHPQREEFVFRLVSHAPTSARFEGP